MYNEKIYLNKSENSIDEISYEEDEEMSNIEEYFISKETKNEIAKEIENLDTIYRDVIILRYAYGYSLEEIANILGINFETVKKRLLRGTAKLKKSLEKREQNERG